MPQASAPARRLSERRPIAKVAIDCCLPCVGNKSCSGACRDQTISQAAWPRDWGRYVSCSRVLRYNSAAHRSKRFQKFRKRLDSRGLVAVSVIVPNATVDSEIFQVSVLTLKRRQAISAAFRVRTTFPSAARGCSTSARTFGYLRRGRSAGAPSTSPICSTRLNCARRRSNWSFSAVIFSERSLVSCSCKSQSSSKSSASKSSCASRVRHSQ